MSIDEQTAAKIDDYLNERLNTEERLFFEAELAINRELSEEVEIQRNLLRIIGENNISLSTASAFKREEIDEVATFLRSEEMNQIRTNIKEVHRQYFRKDQRPRSLFYAMTGLAASIILFVCISIILQQGPDRNELYGTYKDTFKPLSLIERSSPAPVLTTIESNFEEEKFGEVLRSISEHPELLRKHPSLFLYQGISFRELGQHQNALASFDNYGIYSDLDLELVYWHKGLVFLQMEDYASARETFEKINTEGNFKGVEEVKQIVKSLN